MNAPEILTLIVAVSSLALTILMFILNFRQNKKHHKEDTGVHLATTIVFTNQADKIEKRFGELKEALSILTEIQEDEDLALMRNLVEVTFNLKMQSLYLDISLFEGVDNKLFDELNSVAKELHETMIILIKDLNRKYNFPLTYQNIIERNLFFYMGRMLRTMTQYKPK